MTSFCLQFEKGGRGLLQEAPQSEGGVYRLLKTRGGSFPPHFQPTTEKLLAVTHIPLFQTAYKMMSCWCIVAGQVLAKKSIVYY